MIKVLIFDFDGVILDSTEIKTEAFKSLFSKFNKDLLDKIIIHHNNHLGMSRYEKIDFYYNKILLIKKNQKEIDKVAEEYSKLVFKKIIECDFIPGAFEFITNFSKKYLFFISSGTPESELVKICNERDISSYFLEVLGTPNKKHFHINYILNKYNFRNSELLFIGDANNDYEVAKQNGLHFIGINYRNNFTIDHKYIVNNLFKIEEILNKIEDE